MPFPKQGHPPQGGLHHWHRKGGRKGPAPPLGKYSGHSLFKPKNTVFPLPLIIPTLKITMFLNEKEKSFSNWKCRRQALLTCGLLQSPWGAEFGKSLSHWRKGAQLNKNLRKSPWQLRKGNKGFSSSLLLPPPLFFNNWVMRRKFQTLAWTEVGLYRDLPAVSLNNANLLTTWQHFKQLSSVIT